MITKIILITGATDGIGKVAAKTMAKQGHTVIIHGRNQNKAQKVCEEIIAKTGNNKVDIITGDLFSLAEVKRMAAAYNRNTIGWMS
ncbi:SDR family NAD(P)-dependent oxidoreductase [Paenibacillus sp. ALE2]